FREEQFIEIGDFLGFAVKRAVDAGIEKVIIAGMPGKISKLANGNMDLHSSKSSINFDFLASLGEYLGYDHNIVSGIRHANTVLEVMELIKYDTVFLNLLKDKSLKNIDKITENKIQISIEIIKNEY
ncbi:MAG TPA: cobalt-precorrin-6A synthase, partial [Ferroplasma sp.]|nr:cobalt-precorrin-6A synthase [Ferroplasma sp.]